MRTVRTTVRRRTSENSVMTKFAFWGFSELRSNNLPHSEGALDHRGGASLCKLGHQ